MNRKLINGLLLLTVATGGVGTFTSCKDNEEGIEIKKDQARLFDLLDEKIKQGDDNLAVVKDKLNALLDAGLLTERNQEYLVDLITNNANYAKELKTYVDDMVMSLITNVQIEEVYNPAFGTINLPLGIQNGLLCNYYYQADHEVDYPMVDDTNIVYGDKEAQDALDKSGLTPKGALSLGTEVQDIKRLGEIYVTINPASIPEKALKGLIITMHKTNGEQVLGELKAVKEDDHVKNFGYTRADNGFYKIEVGVAAADVPSINLNLDDNLKAAAKDFVKSPSKSDLIGLAEAIYKQFNNRIPALGLQFAVNVPLSFNYDMTPWNPGPGGLLLPNVTVDADGNYILNGNTPANNPEGVKGETENVTADQNKEILRSVYSKYDIAAVTYHPLSYAFNPEGYVTDRRLPEIGHIQEIVDRVFDKAHFDLTIDGSKYTIDLSKATFTIKDSEIVVNAGGLEVVNDNGDHVGYVKDGETITLKYDSKNEESALYPFVESILEAVNGKDGFKDQLATEVNAQLQKIIAEVNADINTKVNDKIASIKESIDNELNGRLGDGVNALIDLYNKLAKKVNAVLDNPNAYMQVYAAYRDGDGDLHQLSSVASDPSVFIPGSGDAIQMFLTSYNGELLAPAYKKYVAVLDKNGKSVEAANAAPYLNTVLEGRQQRTYIPVSALTPGETYQVIYTALDYRGYVSARSFYIKVAK